MMTRLASPMIPIFIALLAVLLLDTDHHRSARANDDDTYQQELVKGKDLLRRRLYDEALKSFKRANEMREKKSAECFNLMSEAYLGLGAHKNVIESADKVIELAGDEIRLGLAKEIGQANGQSD